MTLCTVVNITLGHDFDVYAGRARDGWAGLLGNPFFLQYGGTRGETLERFKPYFYDRVSKDPEFRQRVLDCRGKRLGCYCAPLPCHATTIADWVNEQFSGMTFTERPYRKWTLREWRCCGHLWQLLLTRAFPDRVAWAGPVCPTCKTDAAWVRSGFA